MKDTEFIELLNLYLDHEIPAADAVRLEAEVQGNAARRRVYQDYCRMQKACKLLAHDFQTDAASAGASQVVAFDSEARPARGIGLFALGAFAAAAACLALIFGVHHRQSLGLGTAQPVVAQVEPATPSPAPAFAQVATTPLRREVAPSMLVSGPLLLTPQTQADSVFTHASEQPDAQFAWMYNVQLAPIQPRIPVEDMRFDARPSLRPDGRALGKRPPVPDDGPMSAFRFER